MIIKVKGMVARKDELAVSFVESLGELFGEAMQKHVLADVPMLLRVEQIDLQFKAFLPGSRSLLDVLAGVKEPEATQKQINEILSKLTKKVLKEKAAEKNVEFVTITTLEVDGDLYMNNNVLPWLSDPSMNICTISVKDNKTLIESTLYDFAQAAWEAAYENYVKA